MLAAAIELAESEILLSIVSNDVLIVREGIEFCFDKVNDLIFLVGFLDWID